MKNHIIISLLFLSIGLSQKEYNYNDLIEMDNGLYTIKFSDEPITGRVYDYFEEFKPYSGAIISGKKVYMGNLLNGEKEGKWVYYHQKSDSIMMVETYKNDSLYGFQKTYFTNGKLAEKTNYVNGQKDGKSFIYADNGQVTKDLNYKDGELHGPAIYYTPKGEKLMEGQYTEGSKTGTWKYFSDGKLEKEEDY